MDGYSNTKLDTYFHTFSDLDEYAHARTYSVTHDATKSDANRNCIAYA